MQSHRIMIDFCYQTGYKSNERLRRRGGLSHCDETAQQFKIIRADRARSLRQPIWNEKKTRQVPVLQGMGRWVRFLLGLLNGTFWNGVQYGKSQRRAIQVVCFWDQGMNIQRDPYVGRNFEYFSEILSYLER